MTAESRWPVISSWGRKIGCVGPHPSRISLSPLWTAHQTVYVVIRQAPQTLCRTKWGTSSGTCPHPHHTHTHTCAHTHSLLRDESRSAFRLLPTPYPAFLPFLSPQPHQGRSILLSLCSDQENALFHLNSSKSSSAIESYVQH